MARSRSCRSPVRSYAAAHTRARSVHRSRAFIGAPVAMSSSHRRPVVTSPGERIPVNAGWLVGDWRSMAESTSVGNVVDRRMALAREWDDLVAQVRRLQGFEDFLLPPKLETLLPAAERGPVVIVNVSR